MSTHMLHDPARASFVSGYGGQPMTIPPSHTPFSPGPGGTQTSFAPAPPAASGSFAPPHGSGHASFAQPPPPPAAMSALSIPHPRMEPPPLGATQGPMPGTLERPIQGPKKRLIITCDGTWLDADNGLINGQKQPPSNVSRIGWAIKETSRDGIPQVVNYQAGVGTHGSRLAKAYGGATGAGIKENIREAYTYIATNWREGDEIFLLGFSRGAFTARSVGGIIGSLGLLTRKGLPYFSEIFEDLEHKDDSRYNSLFPDFPFPQKGPFDDRYVHELQKQGMTRVNVPIKAICCWDTVGSLGIPRTPWLEAVSMRPRKLKDYQFSDTRISPHVENAFQALALDENRAPFSPALWERQSDNQFTNLKQVWFPGVHSNIGGGYDDQEIANLTLAWMMSRLEPFLDFRPDFLVSQLDALKHYYRDSGQKPRWWGFGEIYRSLKGPYSLTGSKVRTPGAYERVNPYNGRSTGKRLKNTNEYIHASVRARVGLRGPGPQDRGDYNPMALADWTFDAEPQTPGASSQGQGGNMGDGMMVVWNYRGSKDHEGQTRIPEAVLLDTELALLQQFQSVDDYIRYMRPPSGGKRRSKRNPTGEPNGTPINGGPVPTPIPPMAASKRRGTGGGGPPHPDDFAVPVDGEMDGEDRPERRRRHRKRATSVGPDGDVDEKRDRDRDRDRDGDKDKEREERRRRRTSTRY